MEKRNEPSSPDLSHDPASLRVAMLSPISWRTPPRHYGPWEQVVSNLTEALVARGVDVTLFATADSLTSAKLASVCPRPYSEDPAIDAKVWECLHIAHVFERARAGEFDLIHNHFDFLPLSYGGLVDTPVLTTIHGFSSPRILPVYEKYNRRAHYVAISDADRAPSLEYVATIHHGIRMENFPFTPQPHPQRQPQSHRAGSRKAGDEIGSAADDDRDGYLLFFGRIHPDKGAAEAIAVAKRTGRRLVLAGIIQDERYFEREVAPHLDGGTIEYIGSVGPDRRGAVLGGAAVLLHLINFDEPFGLSVVESMACGTPVIACSRGSMPELIRDGVNGFLTDGTIDGAVAAVVPAVALDRAAVRASVERRFSIERMTDAYLEAYRTVLEHSRRQR